LIAAPEILDFYFQHNFGSSSGRILATAKVHAKKAGLSARIDAKTTATACVSASCADTRSAKASSLHDVDIDWAAGASIALALLPATDFMFGRASKKISHCWYTTSEPLKSFKYEDPTDKTCLIELRGTKLDGTLGNQTMAPPSVWSFDTRA
jgi:hypothetical protein